MHVLGSTPRCSDSRIILSKSLNCAAVVGMYFLASILTIESHRNAIILGVILSWFFSHNIMFSIGMIKPFKIVNKQLEQ